MRIKRGLVFLTFGLFIVFSAITAFAQENTQVPLSPFFYDTPSNHQNYTAIRWLKFHEVLQGYLDGTYKPDAKISRAELTKIVIAAEFDTSEIENCTPTTAFGDVHLNEWYAKYVCVALNHNIVQGYPDNSFRPANNITFVEAAKIITQALKYQVSADATWYKPYVTKLEEEKAAPLTIDRLDKEITRGEMAEMIFRLKADVSNKPTTSFFSKNQGIIPSITEKKGCDQNAFRMAFIVVTKPGTSMASSATLQKLQTLAKLFDATFFKATRYLVKMETNIDITTIEITDDLIYPNGLTNPSNNTYSLDNAKVVKRFYETHPDDYDFISIFADGVNIGSSSTHVSIRNRIQNIGQEVMDSDYTSTQYGTGKRLLGINEIIFFNNSVDQDTYLWTLLHETGHQWCCGINNSQLKIGDGSHLSTGFDNPHRSSILSDGATIFYSFNKKNGTFLTENNPPLSELEYDPFTLYFMGVLPGNEYAKAYDVYNPIPYGTANADGVGKATFLRTVSIKDIINAEGLRSCKP